MAKLLVLVLEGWQGRMTSCGIPRESSSVETLAESPASVASSIILYLT